MYEKQNKTEPLGAFHVGNLGAIHLHRSAAEKRQLQYKQRSIVQASRCSCLFFLAGLYFLFIISISLSKCQAIHISPSSALLYSGSFFFLVSSYLAHTFPICAHRILRNRKYNRWRCSLTLSLSLNRATSVTFAILYHSLPND